MQLVWSLTEFSIVIVFQFFSAFLLKAIRKQTSLWNKNCITFMRVIGRRLVSSVDVLILLNSSMWIVDDSSLLCIISLLWKMVFWPYEHTNKQFILARLFSMRKRIIRTHRDEICAENTHRLKYISKTWMKVYWDPDNDDEYSSPCQIIDRQISET